MASFRKCPRCSKLFEGRKKYCPECRSIVDKEIRKRYADAHKAEAREYMRNYQQLRKKPAICKDCGKEFKRTGPRQECCTACSAKRRSNKTITHERKAPSSLAEINSIARSRGKSYGQQVAEMFVQANVCK